MLLLKMVVPRLLPTLVPVKENVLDAAVAWALATPAESTPHNIRLSLAYSFDRLVVVMIVPLIMLVLV